MPQNPICQKVLIWTHLEKVTFWKKIAAPSSLKILLLFDSFRQLGPNP